MLAGRSLLMRSLRDLPTKAPRWLILLPGSRPQMAQTARYPTFAHSSSSGDLKENPDMASNK